MRRTQKQLTMTAAGALLAALGAAMAQQTPRPVGGPDSAQSNNERQTGIQNNTNNSYKTWPETLNPSAPSASGRQAANTGTRSMAQGSSNGATGSSSSTGTGMSNSGAANPGTLPARADRN
jgi:hypothetical protein